MPNTVQPAFLRYQDEAAIIGRILAGYGDLELSLCHAVVMANDDLDGTVKAIFGERGEKDRILRARRMGLESFKTVRLKTEFEYTISAMIFCLNIRNQYAHCQWTDTPEYGLGFVNLEEIAMLTIKVDYQNLTYYWLDIPLLEQQESYFAHTQNNLTYLNYEGRFRAKKLTTQPPLTFVKQARPPLHKFQAGNNAEA